MLFAASLIVAAFQYGKILGIEQGKASITCPPPKVVRGTYSTEELHRIIRARKRMEAVK
jgi:hypothetical protein